MFIEGFSAHAQIRLTERFGITSLEDFATVRKIVFGVEGTDWVKDSSDTISQQGNPSVHGRRFSFRGISAIAVVAKRSSAKNDTALIVTTVLEPRWTKAEREIFVEPDHGPLNPKELQAHNAALEDQRVAYMNTMGLLEAENGQLKDEVKELLAQKEEAIKTLTRAQETLGLSERALNSRNDEIRDLRRDLEAEKRKTLEALQKADEAVQVLVDARSSLKKFLGLS